MSKAQNDALKAAKAKMKATKDEYYKLAADPETPQGKLHAVSMAVKDVSREVSAAITLGCEPCPGCQQVPHGMEQPGRRGAFEYEIGCLGCKPFDHTDGTRREYRVRGGLMPSHAVDAWNAGPDLWLKEVPKAVKDTSAPEKEPSE
jgi:hypothetical protein